MPPDATSSGHCPSLVNMLSLHQGREELLGDHSMRQHLMKISLLISMGFGQFMGTTHASNGEVCGLNGVKLVCAESLKDAESVLDAMANPATLEKLTALRFGKNLFPDAKQREVYRHSLEANRRAMNRHAKRQLRRYRRGRINAVAYEKVREQFKSGMLSYHAGLRLYRNDIWTDPTPPRNKD